MLYIYPEGDTSKLLKGELTIDPSYPVIVGYIRTGKRTPRSPKTIEKQRESIISCCRNRFETGCHLFFVEDIGRSGVAPYSRSDESGVRNSREGLGLLMQLVENDLVNYICVANMTRLSRSLRQFFEIEEVIKGHGVRLLSAGANELWGESAASRLIQVFRMAKSME